MICKESVAGRRFIKRSKVSDGNILHLIELFLKLLTEQQDYLVSNDVENLNRVVKEQEQAILALKNLEASRIRVVEVISEKSDNDPADMTLTRIAASFAAPQSEKLEKMQKSLLNLHERVSSARERNEFLIKKSMEHIDGTVRMLASGGVEVPTYQSGGSKEESRQSIAIDRKA